MPQRAASPAHPRRLTFHHFSPRGSDTHRGLFFTGGNAPETASVWVPPVLACALSGLGILGCECASLTRRARTPGYAVHAQCACTLCILRVLNGCMVRAHIAREACLLTLFVLLELWLHVQLRRNRAAC